MTRGNDELPAGIPAHVLSDAGAPPAGVPAGLWAQLVWAGAVELAGYQNEPNTGTPEGYAGAALRGVVAGLGASLGRTVRIVRAAEAFRQAAPRHSWPHAPWLEMAELCAAVDGKPGPDASQPEPLTKMQPSRCAACSHYSAHMPGTGCAARARRGRQCGCLARNDDQPGPAAGGSGR